MSVEASDSLGKGPGPNRASTGADGRDSCRSRWPAFVLTYEAARLGLAAILVNQGLRPRGDGAHAVLLDVVLAQLEPPRQEEFRESSWMRPLRNDTQYPSVDKPVASADDLAQAIPAADAIIDRAETLLHHMPPF